VTALADRGAELAAGRGQVSGQVGRRLAGYREHLLQRFERRVALRQKVCHAAEVGHHVQYDSADSVRIRFIPQHAGIHAVQGSAQLG
jgi:hypothetical protein